MNIKKRILVFPCGSEIGLEIHNALEYSRHVELYGGSSVDDHGNFVYKNYIGGLPFIYDKNFISKLNKIITEYKIDYIYPAHDDVVYKLAKNEKKIACKLIGPTDKTAEICRFKAKTYEFFKNLLPVPKVYENATEIKRYPVFLKPNAGQGSRGTFVANNKDEVEHYLRRDKSLLILEFLPGREYTVDCFTNRNGKLLFAGPRVRARIQNGISVNTFPVKNKHTFINYAEIINSNLKLRGAWFFQVKRNSYGKLVLLEIANRIAGSMALYRNLGINFPLLTIYDMSGINVRILQNNYRIELDRALANRFKIYLDYDEVYVDLDDCLLIKQNLNTRLISFLFQCVNNNKKIYLITRRARNLGDILQKYRINHLFDKIYKIDNKQAKSDLIKNSKAIFIDDSFAERLEVYTKKRIPVFSVDAIECLLE